MDVILLTLSVLGVMACLLHLTIRLDEERIRKCVAEDGGRVLDIARDPSGTPERSANGWRVDKGARVYDVRFRDKKGNERTARCSTSLLYGICFSNDDAMQPASPRPRGEETAETPFVKK